MSQSRSVVASFDEAVRDARTFERQELDRHRGLVELWVGLIGVLLGAGFLLPELEDRSPKIQYVMTGGFALAYGAALFLAWLPFRFSFRWRGAWSKANSWHWGSLGGFLAAWFGLSQLLGILSLFLAGRVLPSQPADFGDFADYKTQMAGVQLLAISLSILFINYWARDWKEIFVGAAGAVLGVLAIGWPSATPGLMEAAGVAMFAPMILLGLFRLIPWRSRTPA